MEPAQQPATEAAGGNPAVGKAIISMESLLSEARQLVQGTNAIFQRNGISREKMAEIAMQTGVAALGAQMRKEEAAVDAPKKSKKKAKRARVKL